MTNFVSLHNQTTYSILDSIAEVKPLFKRAKELNQPAVALTEHGSLASLWEAWKASKETGVKLIAGCEFYFQDEATNSNDKMRHLILLAKNAIGYRNLLTLNKKGFDNNSFIGKKVYSVIDWKLLEQHSDGLICLTACGNGIVSQLLMKHKMEEAEQALLRLHKMFGDNLGIEILPNHMKRGANIFNEEIDQFFLNRQLYNLGKKHNIRVVAACNTHYLTKEEAETHDAFLTIGSHQPMLSNFRLKYNTPEFYLKTGEEVKTFFTRNYGEAAAQDFCDNSLYFANLCEVPEWIDPKFSNPNGKELPIFPVKDEIDYVEFGQWLQIQSAEVQKLTEPSAYLRFKCLTAFDKMKEKIASEKHEEYAKRIETELSVLDYQGFSSYMLVVADYVNWAKQNGVPVGPGRGCLVGDTKVLTSGGFKRLDNIQIGEQVYTHTGQLREVLNTMKYDVCNEKLLKLKMENVFGTLSLTSDHKVFACKRDLEDIYTTYYCQFLNGKGREYHHQKVKLAAPSWIEAKELHNGDFIYTSFPITNNIPYTHTFDLGKYVIHNLITADNKIEVNSRSVSKVSIRDISRVSGIGFEAVRRAKNNCLKDHIKLQAIEKYLSSLGLSLSEWQDIPKYKVSLVDRYIELDNEWLYILGRWVGDGCIRYKQKNGITYAFNIHDRQGINRIQSYFEKIGFNCYCKVLNQNGYSIEIGTTILSDLFKEMFPNYNNSSYTKHLPIFFRLLSKDQLRHLINGLIDSDGHVRKNQLSESIKTTSLQLAEELKECFNLLQIKSSVVIEQANTHNKRNNATSYTIRFSGFNTPLKIGNVYGNGYYSKITNIEECQSQYVYDITVDKDSSYLTSTGAVHNSGAGSMVGYLLGIHQADPIKYDLLFERFQQKGRTAAPDYDLDFGTQGRHKVVEYIINKYGRDHVAQVSNFSTITPKVYVRDIARNCEFGRSKEETTHIGDSIADIIPVEIKTRTALNNIPLYAEYAKKYPALQKYDTILGKPRNLSTHAAALVIGQRSLVGLVPLRRDKDGSLALECEKNTTEELGLVKMDLLGLSTLDIITATNQLIQQAGKTLPIIDYDLYDQKTYDLITKGDTYGVFQFGTSGGTIDLCKKVKPKNIDDLSIITTLARPAAADIRKDFIETREGKRTYSLTHPLLEGAFAKTFGFGLYDESILKLGCDVAGWDLNEADRLRKMIKEKGKYPEKDKKLRQQFITDAVRNNALDERIATIIWDNEIKKFAGYTFNRAHATTYSMISYHTAFLKANYPVEFLLANLLAEVGSNALDARPNIDKIKKELRQHKVKIMPPDLNRSQLIYAFEEGGKLITGLNSIKFVSEDAIKDLIAKRPFKDFFDFMVRISSKTVRSNSIQALAACGALDGFNIPRKQLFLYCSDYRKKLSIWLKKHDPNTETFTYPFPIESDWTTSEKYALEQYYLGEAFICKPPLAYGQFFNDNHATIHDIKKCENRTKISSMKGIIRDFFEFRIKKEKSKYYGQPMLKVVIEDKNGEQCTMTIFPDQWKMIQKRLPELNRKAQFEAGLALHFSGSVNVYEEQTGFIIDQLFNISLPPAGPLDLKAKKISLKKSKEDKNFPTTYQELLEEVENSLYNEGLIDLDAEEDEEETNDI